MSTNALTVQSINISSTALVNSFNPVNLYRFVVKNGEYIYARVNDIVLVESCDHWVKIHLVTDDKIRLVIRNNTLKDFLTQLPEEQFTRIGRFCAININRLTGGSYNSQSFEFDFRISIKLKHGIPLTAFNALGR